MAASGSSTITLSQIDAAPASAGVDPARRAGTTVGPAPRRPGSDGFGVGGGRHPVAFL